MDLELLKAYALAFIGKVYHWTGDDPVAGFDCSGFASELARAAGLVPWNFRANAQGLFERLNPTSVSNLPTLGAFAFYGKDEKSISHVGFCLDSFTMIEAGGGDETTVNDTVAANKNAFVRLRPIRYRKDFLCVVRPAYNAFIPGERK